MLSSEEAITDEKSCENRPDTASVDKEPKANLKKTKEVRPPKRKITQDQVLEEQYKALLLKQNNLKLQTKKLELEIALLELQVKREKESCLPLATVANLSPIAAGRPFLY